MGIVVDANIVVAYYSHEVLGNSCRLTRSPKLIFSKQILIDSIYVDSDGKIVNEWRQGVEREWFDIWYTDLLRDDIVREIKPLKHQHLRKALLGLGFPCRKDFWYVAVGFAVVAKCSFCALISEDMDFYDPKHKGCDSAFRKRTLGTGDGDIARFLRKKCDIHVCSVENFLNLYPVAFESLRK